MTSFHLSRMWLVGGWLVSLQVSRVETVSHSPEQAVDPDFIDWDALAEQYGAPVNGSGDGLQLCAHCRRSVARGSGRFVNRVPLDDFQARIECRYRFPVGAFLCAECDGKRTQPQTKVNFNGDVHDESNEADPHATSGD